VQGHFVATYRDDVHHAPAPAPFGGWVTRIDYDASKWAHMGSLDSIFGYLAVGQISTGHPSESTWMRATGLIVPLWPISLVAGFFCLRIAQRAWLSQKNPALCPTCRYDLRAHAPGQSCPECGTSIPPPAPRLVDSPA
jgi:hypothetical protein